MYISQKLDVYNEDGEVGTCKYYVFEEDEIIGEVSVTEVDGEKISCFVYGGFEEVEKAYKEEEEVCFLAQDDSIFMSKENEVVVVAGKHGGKKSRLEIEDVPIKREEVEELVEKNPISEDVKLEDENNIEEFNVDEIEAKDFNTSVSYHPSVNYRKYSFINGRKTNNTTLNYQFLKVGFRKNKSINGGICYAASGASIISYKTKTYYKTMDVYNKLNDSYKGTPMGTVTWIKRMWNLYGLNMTYVPNRLSYQTVYNELKKGNPIFCVFARSDTSNASRNVHAVVLCGTYYVINNGKYYYIYMDPNYFNLGDNKDKAADEIENIYVVNSVKPSTMNTNGGYEFYYYTGKEWKNKEDFEISKLRNNWYQAFY